jgi:hypothetical protein
VEAASSQAVQRFLAFLPGPGGLHISRACTAEEAVERGGCGPGRHADQLLIKIGE